MASSDFEDSTCVVCCWSAACCCQAAQDQAQQVETTVHLVGSLSSADLHRLQRQLMLARSHLRDQADVGFLGTNDASYQLGSRGDCSLLARRHCQPMGLHMEVTQQKTLSGCRSAFAPSTETNCIYQKASLVAEVEDVKARTLLREYF